MPTSKTPGSDIRQHQIKQRQHKPRCENEQNTKGRPQNNTFVSSITAQRIPVLTMAVLRLLSVSWWYSWDPWEKLKRATFMPALSSFSIIGTDLEAGPKVQTILVFGFFSIAVETPQLASIFFFFLCCKKGMNFDACDWDSGTKKEAQTGFWERNVRNGERKRGC